MNTTPAHRAIAQRNKYVEEHLWLVDTIAKSLLRRMLPCFEFDDLRQAGCLGLLDAATRYNRALNVPFKSYAALRIRGAILDSVRRRHSRNATALPITEGVLEMPGAGAEELEHQVEHAELAHLIAQAKEGLTAGEREALTIYFEREERLAGVGEAFHVRQSRSSQIVQMAKRSMERELAYRGLKRAA